MRRLSEQCKRNRLFHIKNSLTAHRFLPGSRQSKSFLELDITENKGGCRNAVLVFGDEVFDQAFSAISPEETFGIFFHTNQKQTICAAVVSSHEIG